VLAVKSHGGSSPPSSHSSKPRIISDGSGFSLCASKSGVSPRAVAHVASMSPQIQLFAVGSSLQNLFSSSFLRAHVSRRRRGLEWLAPTTPGHGVSPFQNGVPSWRWRQHPRMTFFGPTTPSSSRTTNSNAPFGFGRPSGARNTATPWVFIGARPWAHG